MFWRLFHRSKIERYLGEGQNWALVTGSTDGIGKSLADQLLAVGFNVLIHGRSPEKVARVVSEMQTRHPARQVASVIADFSNLEHVDNVVAALRDHRVTVLINNAAATDREYLLFADMPQEQVDRTLTVNILFLTRLLSHAIPILSGNSPSLIINIGSQSAETPTPFVSIYGASKAYLLTLTKTLAIESRLRKDAIEIYYADIHNVNSATNRLEVSLLAPSSDTIAEAILYSVGCGFSFVTPYWTHELSRYSTYILPRMLIESLSISTINSIMDAHTAWKSGKGRLQQ